MKIIKRLSELNYKFLAIFWTVLITVASLVSFNAVPKVTIPGNDKLVHFLFYFGFVVLWGLAKRQISFQLNYNLKLVVVAVFYGMIIEVLQAVVTINREADLYDALANTLGAIVGFVCLFWIKNKIFNKYF